MKMPFRRPHSRERVGVRKLRPFHQESIAVLRVLSLVAGEIEKTEINRPARGTSSVLGHRNGWNFAAVEDNGEATSQGPEQFQDGDIKRNTRHGQPDTRLALSNPGIHPTEEVDHVAMLNHHPFGLAGRTRGVNHIREVAGGDLNIQICHGFLTDLRPIGVDGEPNGMRRQVGLQEVLAGNQNADLGILQDKSDPFPWITRVERQVRPARLQNAKQRHKQIRPSFQ